MNITLFVTQGAIQFNLEPETPHEKEMLKILEKYKGKVEIKKGIDLGMSHAGYIRSFDELRDGIAIVVHVGE